MIPNLSARGMTHLNKVADSRIRTYVWLCNTCAWRKSFYTPLYYTQNVGKVFTSWSSTTADHCPGSCTHSKIVICVYIQHLWCQSGYQLCRWQLALARYGKWHIYILGKYTYIAKLTCPRFDHKGIMRYCFDWGKRWSLHSSHLMTYKMLRTSYHNCVQDCVTMYHVQPSRHTRYTRWKGRWQEMLGVKLKRPISMQTQDWPTIHCAAV